MAVTRQFEDREFTEDRFSARTPADLKALRILLGMSTQQLGDVFGIKQDDVSDLEDMHTHFVYAGHADFLESMLSRVNSLVDLWLDRDPPESLVQYPNDGAFRDFEPDLSWMIYSTVHQMFIARVCGEWLKEGHRPKIATLVPARYREFNMKGGRVDSPEARSKWAWAYTRQFKEREGLPPKPKRSLKLKLTKPSQGPVSATGPQGATIVRGVRIVDRGCEWEVVGFGADGDVVCRLLSGNMPQHWVGNSRNEDGTVNFSADSVTEVLGVSQPA